MHRPNVRSATRVLFAAFLLVMVGCGEERASFPTERESQNEVAMQAAEPAHRELARLVALSLQEPSARGVLHRALAASTVQEQKLHVDTFLRGQGRSLLERMARSGSSSEERVLELAARSGALEVYLPVAEHRARWSGGADLIVAAQSEEDEIPYGVDLHGREVALSLASPPDTPALVLVPAESFDAQGRPLQSATTKQALRASAGSAALAATSWTGVWVNEVHVGNLHESWTRGSPEFEMHLERSTLFPRGTLVCAEEDYSIEPYRWDMDEKDYYETFLIGRESEIPADIAIVISMWEDDDGRCVLKTYNATDYVKVVTDYLKSVTDVFKGLSVKKLVSGRWIMRVVNAYIAGKSLVSGGDDFVGVAAGLENVTGIPKQFVLKDQNMNNQGRVILQWRTEAIE